MVDYAKFDHIGGEDPQAGLYERGCALRKQAADLLLHGQPAEAVKLYNQALQTARQASAAACSEWDGIFRKSDSRAEQANCRELEHSVAFHGWAALISPFAVCAQPGGCIRQAGRPPGFAPLV